MVQVNSVCADRTGPNQLVVYLTGHVQIFSDMINWEVNSVNSGCTDITECNQLTAKIPVNWGSITRTKSS